MRILKYITMILWCFCLGSVMIAQTTGSFTDKRDGKTYKWVKIGEQIWMAENLAFEPESGNFSIYDKKKENLAKYGYLYDWETALTACPAGWHLPSSNEFQKLVDFVGSDPGVKLKAKSGWDMDGDGTDAFGFTALPGGALYRQGFDRGGNGAQFWSTTERPVPSHIKRRDAIELYISSILDNVEITHQGSTACVSVRCIKD